MKLNKHFQMCEMDYLALLHVKTLISRLSDLNKIRWIKKKGSAMLEGGRKKLISRADIQSRETVIYFFITVT